MTDGVRTNGYVNLSTLVLVVGTLATGLAAYVTLSIAPLQKEIDANSEAIKDIRAEVVPRAEHQRDWDAQLKTDSYQDQRIDEIIRSMGGAYSMRDELLRLQTQMDGIQGLKKPEGQH